VAEEWTTDELLDDIREQGRIADDDPDATDAKLLAQADKQLKTRFVPMLRKARSEWYVTFEDQALVAGQAEYRIPSRAATSSIRTVLWYDASGNRYVCNPRTLSDQHATARISGRPGSYTIQDDRIVLMPKPSSAIGTLRIYYERRPSTLVPTSSAYALVAGVDGLAYDITTTPGSMYLTTGTTNPATFGIAEGGLIDVIKAKPPFSACFTDIEVVAIAHVLTAYLIQFDYDSATMQLPSPGDYLCNAGETVIPQLPPELHPLLSLVTAAQYLKPIDPAAAQELMVDFEARKLELGHILAPRQQGQQMKIRGGSSLRRSSVRGGGTFGDWEGDGS
jgi:hypothetical protein